MVVGLISDTHGLVRPEVFAALEGVQLILHAGDVGAGVLEALEAIAPVRAVAGNTDDPWDPRLARSVSLEIDGVSVHVSHGHELGLTEDEAAIEIEMLEGLRDFLAFRAEVERDGLPVLDTQHRVLGADRCHFWTPAFLPDQVEAGGKLFLTGTRLVFLGGGVQAAPWHAVSTITRDGRDLVAAVPSRGAVLRFRCNAYGEAMRALYVAERLLAESRARRAAPPGGPAPV